MERIVWVAKMKSKSTEKEVPGLATGRNIGQQSLASEIDKIFEKFEKKKLHDFDERFSYTPKKVLMEEKDWNQLKSEIKKEVRD